LKPVDWKVIYKYLDIPSITTDADPETLLFKTPINAKKFSGCISIYDSAKSNFSNYQ